MTLGIADLLSLLEVRPAGRAGTFTGVSPIDGARRVYGGQLLGQSVVAMGRTVRDEHPLHSMQGYFLQPGDVAQPLEFTVGVLREGRNFSTRQVLVTQGTRAVFSGAASFQRTEGKHLRLAPMPDVPPPDQLADEASFYAGEAHLLESRRSHVSLLMQLFERRSDMWRPWQQPGPLPPRNGMWCRLRGERSDDPLINYALIAYFCDLDLMSTAMRPRGCGAMDPGARSASLDHAMWFHAPAFPDRWFYYDLDGPCAVNNRGLGAGAIYQDGRRIATTMQEGLLRVDGE